MKIRRRGLSSLLLLLMVLAITGCYWYPPPGSTGGGAGGDEDLTRSASLTVNISPLYVPPRPEGPNSYYDTGGSPIGWRVGLVGTSDFGDNLSQHVVAHGFPNAFYRFDEVPYGTYGLSVLPRASIHVDDSVFSWKGVDQSVSIDRDLVVNVDLFGLYRIKPYDEKRGLIFASDGAALTTLNSQADIFLRDVSDQTKPYALEMGSDQRAVIQRVSHDTSPCGFADYGAAWDTYRAAPIEAPSSGYTNFAPVTQKSAYFIKLGSGAYVKMALGCEYQISKMYMYFLKSDDRSFPY